MSQVFTPRMSLKSLPVEANNSTIELHLPVEAKEKIAMIDESKPLPDEANNSTIELHLAVEAKEKLSEYIESKSLPGSVLVYRYTRTDTIDPTICNS